jgi:hypothetical protein
VFMRPFGHERTPNFLAALHRPSRYPRFQFKVSTSTR